MTTIARRQRVVIVGGGYAGMLAAARLTQARTEAEIVLLDAQPAFAERIRFHEIVAGAKPRTLQYGPALARRGVRFVQARVTELDPAAQQVRAMDHVQQPITLGYDYLIVALGSRTVTDVAGAAHSLALNDLPTIAASATQLRALAQRGGQVLVVGAGLTGIETATELAERLPGLRVTLTTRGLFAADYSAAAGCYLRARLAQLGITLLEDTAVQALEAQVAHTTQGALPFDACIWSGGFAASPLARSAGLVVDDAGRIAVDPWLRAQGNPTIFAVGDAAAVEVGHGLRMGCVSAIPTGAYAGALLGQTLRGSVPQAEMQPFGMDFMLRCVSLGRQAGLVQWTQPDDTPQDRIWSGRPAVWTKEAICRMTFAVVRNELRWGLPLYRWPQGATAQPPVATLEEAA